MAAIHGIGLDLIEIERIEHALERHRKRFLERVFTAEEIRYCQEKTHPQARAASFAARWAAKEALAKALGTGIGAQLQLREIEVRSQKNAPPQIRLHGQSAQTAAAFGIGQILLSLTHNQSTAAAQVILLKRSSEKLT